MKLKDVFGFAEHQEKAKRCLCYKLKLTENKDEAVIDMAPGIADARNKIDYVHWCFPHFNAFYSTTRNTF